MKYLPSCRAKSRRPDRVTSATPRTTSSALLGMAAILVLAFPAPLFALTPGDLSRVRFEQHPGQQIARDLFFRDESGRAVRIGDFFSNRPVILVLGYYRCPMLCTMINDGLINALENLRASVGSDFNVVEISIDPNETATAAAERKALYLRRYGRRGTAEGWHCLIGDAGAITQLADEVGFRYAYDPQVREYAHPSGVVVLTPDARISRYVFGVTFDSTELRDALTAAKEGKFSSVLSQIFLLCYHYNPITGKYGVLILSVLRLASAAFVISLAVWVFRTARSSTKRVTVTG